MKKFITLFTFILSVTVLYGQSGSIKGKVVTTSGNPVENANVLISGSNNGTTTDNNGNYVLQNISKGTYTLKVSSIGFKPDEINIQIKNGDVYNVKTIVLEELTEYLDEVILNGNGKNDFVVKQPSSSLRIKTETAKLPQNIQIISDEVIESQNIINMMESVTRNVSGAQMIEHWGHFARINMRGFKLPAFRNGMNVELPWGPLSEDMSMVQSIEFVKGPAGFMLSAGEPGGFYNVVTKKPVKESINEVSLTAGSFNTFRGALDSGGSLTSDGRFQYRINGMYQTQESHRDFEESSRYSIVPSFKYEISDKTSVLTEFTYQRAEQLVGAAYVFGTTEGGFGNLPRDFTNMEENFPKTDIEELSILTNVTHNFNSKWSVQAQHMYLRYGVQGASAWVAGVENNGDILRSVSIWDALSTNQLAQIYLNGEFNTGGITHKILAGFDFRNLNYYADWNQGGTIDVNTPFNIYNPVYGSAVYPQFDRSQPVKVRGAGNHQGNNYRAYYLQDEIWMLNDKLRVTLAGRYNDAEIFAYGDTSDASKFTPRVGASYDILSGFAVYGLYDQSFIPQYGASITGERFDPVEAIDYEGGLKKSWFNNHLNTTLSVYQITKENILVGDPENPNFSIQLGEVQSKGIEFDMQGQITPALNVVLNYANTNVEITEDTNPDRVGLRVSGHSKHITNGWFHYNFLEDTPLNGFGISLGYQYQVDRSSWNWGADNESALPDYFRLDGGLSWKNNKWAVNLNVNNILDEYLYSGAGYASYVYWQSEPGINGRITIQYKF